ncbi:hypothetical protein QO010_003949 [Caulobacter ginsengisoli]|uniref:Vacuolar membrane protease n=1 Tax=Caulobacter ginsengisoli TaxID=400775 RepID=A0ABU0IXU7_9CAUL|nr:M20/M25/M40 family metallo-hydrolase [Caulobacter ginsengisoli]MDQ0466156.1 hypothetical protein [Caulobacter ginsengisoli]
MGRSVWLLAAMVGGLLIAWQGTVTPRPLAADAPADVFSAGRAMKDIEVVAKTPHPLGSPENDAVRDYLVGRMTAMGLAPRVQDARAFFQNSFNGGQWAIGGRVRNIIGVIPGRDRSAPAIAIMAHYDSVPGSPGAADDATGVASALEIARILKAQGTPARDVIILITDGEEAGLLGAHAFFEQDPLARHVGLVLNMESRGGGGRANMFQTGPRNGALIGLFAENAKAPISSSLAVFLYEHMPNDTDFTVSKAAGITGLNFAFIGRQFDYHSPSSTPANLDQGSVQHMGEQVLAAARALAFAKVLPAPAPEAVYSQTFGDHVLAYPAWVGWLVLLAAVLLLVRAVRPGHKTGVAPLATLKGVGGTLYMILATALMLHLVRRATGVGFGFLEMRPLLAQWGLWESVLALLTAGVALHAASALANGIKVRWAVAAPIAGGALCSLFGGWDVVGLGVGLATAILAVSFLGKPPPLASAWLGALVLALLVALGLQIAAPATAFLIAWPLLLGAFMAAVGALGSSSTPIIRFGEAGLIAIGLGWLGVYFHGVAQGLDIPDLLALFGFLGMVLAWPLAQRASRWTGPALMALGLIGLAVVRFHSPWTERHPQVSRIAYVTDLNSHKSWRVALSPGMDPWTRGVLTADGGALGKQAFAPFAPRGVPAAPAKAVAATQPVINLPPQTDGTVAVLFAPPAEGRAMSLDLRTDVAATDVRVDGRPAKLLAKPGQWSHLVWVGGPGAVTFKPAGPGSVEIRYGAETLSWPADAKPLPARPKTLAPWDSSDSTIVIGSLKQTW